MLGEVQLGPHCLKSWFHDQRVILLHCCAERTCRQETQGRGVVVHVEQVVPNVTVQGP